MQVDQYDDQARDALQRGDVDAALRIAELMDRMPPARRASVPGAALWYAERGLPVFPIQPGSKRPYPRTHGLDDATTDPDRVRAMFTDRPGCNVAIATGHRVDVIDFDGLDAHAAWGQTYPTWADAGITPLGTVSTPRPGGLHVYVPATGEGNYAGMLPGVDYRGLGGYVVVPPSVVKCPHRWDCGGCSESSYTWLTRLPEMLS